MTPRVTFTSWLAPYLHAFVALKRAGGFHYGSEQEMLLRFDRDLGPPLTRAALLAYLDAKAHLAPRSRDNIVSVLWQALAHARRHGAQLDLPPRPPKPVAYSRQRQPRILTETELGTLLCATRRLAPSDGYRPLTTTVLVALLWTTGLRIGEALALDVGDLDPGARLLTVRSGKFGKSRILPLQSSTVAALDAYTRHPARGSAVSSASPVFISQRRRRLCRDSFEDAFYQAWAAASISGPRPRIHDLRHAFAVRTVGRWYAQRGDVNRLLPALSTYLGHVSVENTRQYLVANGSLLQAAAARFARGTTALDEVQP